MDNSLISIIIPVYNAEQYVAKCAESLINQTYKNIEIIFVDDCSTDSSYVTLLPYTEKDSRVKLYTTGTNGGPGKARNVGLDNANGEYIMFCDNDDTYEPDMCEVMLNTMVEKDVDLVTCKAKFINRPLDRALARYVNCNKTGYFNFNKQERICLNVLVWNKIYKKSIIDKYNIRFTTRFAEDDLFTFMYTSVIDSYFGLEKKKLYNLTLRKESYTQTIARGNDSKKKWDKLYIIKEYIDFLEKYNLTEKIYRCLKIHIRTELIYIFKYFKFSIFEIIDFIKKYNDIVKDINKDNTLDLYNVYIKHTRLIAFLYVFNMCCWL